MNVIVAAHSLASRFCFCSAGKRNVLGQSRHRNLLKTMAKALEPTLDADRGDRKVANYGSVNPFYTGVPRDYVGLRESLKYRICDHEREGEEQS